MQLPYALCKVSSTYFQKNPKEAEIALRLIRNSSELSTIIIKYNFKTAAKRLIGAYRFLGNEDMANDLKTELLNFGWNLGEENPFTQATPLMVSSNITSPYAARIFSLWSLFRPTVIKYFPDNSIRLLNPEKYLKELEEIYTQDAYNSLSIEGYLVDENLIAKVQECNWNPDGDLQDNQEKNALAARGYYEAFLEVKKSIATLLQNKSPGEVIKADLKKWYHALFACLKKEPNAAVRAICGHYIFVYIHPYMDGNGRLGRFLMNSMLASGGYPWTIIQVASRAQYLHALEITGTDANIEPFVQFIKQEMQESQGFPALN
jgi:hypothetical protein